MVGAREVAEGHRLRPPPVDSSATQQLHCEFSKTGHVRGDHGRHQSATEQPDFGCATAGASPTATTPMQRHAAIVRTDELPMQIGMCKVSKWDKRTGMKTKKSALGGFVGACVGTTSKNHNECLLSEDVCFH